MSSRGMPVTKGMREAARTRADTRNTAWASLSPEDQLAALDRRLGVNVGAKAQRERIASKMVKPTTSEAKPKKASK